MQAIEHTGGQKRTEIHCFTLVGMEVYLLAKADKTRRIQQNFTTWLLYATTTYVSVAANLALHVYGYFQSMVMAHCQIQPSCGMSLYSYMYYGLAVA